MKRLILSALLVIGLPALGSSEGIKRDGNGEAACFGVDEATRAIPTMFTFDTDKKLEVAASCSVGGLAEDAAHASGETLAGMGAVRDNYPPEVSKTSATNDHAAVGSDDHDVLYTHTAYVGGVLVHACDAFAAVSGTATNGTLKIVTGVSGKKVYVCGFSVTATSAVGLNWISGTGTNCGTSATVVTGVQQVAAKSQINMGTGAFALPFTAVNTDDLCIQTSGASDIGGWISYTIY